MLRFVFGTALIAALLGGAACRRSAERSPASEAPARPAAAYVGDEACADCHEALYTDFHRTGMGRSVSRFDPRTAPERFDGRRRVYNAAFDLYYEPFVRGDTLFQREFRLGPDGSVTYERVHHAAWVVGSGNATRSYLMDVNGYVTEMPLTWYVARARWDLSPAYEQRNFRFSRPISLECMTCHNGLPAYSTFTEGHYTDVPSGITCERCHGPASLHVEKRLAGLDPPAGEPDPDVVHPGRLDRDRQLSVCQQCHLTGVTVYKPGEDATTFRPGQALAAHRTVFAPREQLDDPERFGIASHALRLARSACFQASQMTCTTCHDPHRPVADLGADHFNRACLSCHAPETHGPLCSRDGAATAAVATTGNCTGCHIQQSGTSDIPHVTFTDHWIRRRLPEARAPEDIERVLVRTEPFTLVPVSADGAAARDAAADLEEAVAYFTFYETEHRLPDYLPRVVERARRGLEGGAEHVEARLALGRALAETGRTAEGIRVLEEAAARFPEHARVAYWLGALRLRTGDAAGAAEALARAAGLQPAFVEAHLKQGEALQAAGRMDEAESAFREALRRDPVHHPEGWNNLGFLYLQTGRLEEAARHFDRALALDPDLTTAWINAGTVDLMREDLPAAARRFEQALRLDPDAVPALGNLGLVYARQGRYADARRVLERLLGLQPGDARARALLEQVRAAEAAS